MTTEITTIPDAAEWSAAEVELWLGRRHGWAKRHAVELGGYAADGRFRFPIHRIRAWQLRQAEEFAAQGATP